MQRAASNKKDDGREKPMRGALAHIKCGRFMRLLCCRCCRCQCPCCREPVELFCCCCDDCLAPLCCQRRQCMDFDVYERYPCQRAINIVFVIAIFALLLFAFVLVAKLSLQFSGGGASSVSEPTTPWFDAAQKRRDASAHSYMFTLPGAVLLYAVCLAVGMAGGSKSWRQRVWQRPWERKWDIGVLAPFMGLLAVGALAALFYGAHTVWALRG
jgi:hypothetical protein